MSVEQAAAAVVRRTLAAPATLGSGRLVCIDGPAGSGKTTLADAVLKALPSSLTSRLVHMDDVFVGWSGLVEGMTRVARQLVEPLARAEPGGYRRFDWDADEEAEWHEVAPVDVLVLEGVGSGALDYADRITTLVWMETPRDIGLERGLARDVRMLGLPGVSDVLRGKWVAWMADEDAMFAANRTRDRAHLVVPGLAGG